MLIHLNRSILQDMLMGGYSGGSHVGQPVKPTYRETPHLTYKEGYWSITGIYGEVTGDSPKSAWDKYQKIKVEEITRKGSEENRSGKKEDKTSSECRSTSFYEPSFDPFLLSTFLGMGLL